MISSFIGRKSNQLIYSKFTVKNPKSLDNGHPGLRMDAASNNERKERDFFSSPTTARQFCAFTVEPWSKPKSLPRHAIGRKKKGLSNLVSPFPQRRKRANREQQRIKKKPRRGDGGVGKGNEVDEEIGEDIGGKSRDWCSHQLCCVWNDVFRIYLNSN